MAKAKATRAAKMVSTTQEKPLIDIQLEKVGELRRWVFFKPSTNMRTQELNAFMRGFRTRTEDWLQGKDTPTTVQYRRKADAQAYNNGYVAARAQEQ